MRRRWSDTEAQLALFDMPRTGGSVVRRRVPPVGRTVAPSGLRIALTLLALGISSAGMLAGSFAAWTAQSANPANAVTAGTLEMTNDRNAASLFTATNVRPGAGGTSTVTVSNAGSLPMNVRLTQDELAGSGIEKSLRLKVYDRTRNWCYWPVSQAGSCPSFGPWDASATLSGLPLPAADGATQWASGSAHTFEISWQLAATSPNSDQGQTGTFRLVWDGTQ